MKRMLLFCFPLFFFSSCIREVLEPPINYSEYKPLLMSKTELRNSVSFEAGKSLQRPGKIYFKDNYIFISEQYKGVHIIDNTDPQNPQNIGFIRVPGCLDMAIKDYTLYVDNAVDLLAIDLSDSKNPKIVSRMEDALPGILPPDGGVLMDQYSQSGWPENTVAVDWEKIN